MLRVLSQKPLFVKVRERNTNLRVEGANMDKEVRDKWVEALTSGEYNQGRGHLRTAHNNYCCLGVLCEIAVSEGIIAPPTLEDRKGMYYGYGKAPSTTALPYEVRTWANLSNLEPLIDNVMHMNDDYGCTFNHIADFIDRNTQES